MFDPQAATVAAHPTRGTSGFHQFHPMEHGSSPLTRVAGQWEQAGPARGRAPSGVMAAQNRGQPVHDLTGSLAGQTPGELEHPLHLPDIAGARLRPALRAPAAPRAARRGCADAGTHAAAALLSCTSEARWLRLAADTSIWSDDVWF